VVVQTDRWARAPADAVAALGAGARSAAGRTELVDALEDVAEAARSAVAARLAVVRVAGGDTLEAVAVAGPSVLAAELAGTRMPVVDLPPGTSVEVAAAPAAVRRAAERAGASAVLVASTRSAGGLAALELYRDGPPFEDDEREVAELAAGLAALTVEAFAGRPAPEQASAVPALELAGEALTAALDPDRAAVEIVRLAATAVAAPAGVLWEWVEDDLVLAGCWGVEADADLAAARALATSAPVGAATRPAAAVGLPAGAGSAASIALGRPPVGVLQLLFHDGEEPDRHGLEGLTGFGVRAALVLRLAGERRELEHELDGTRALLALVDRTTADLSVVPRLEAAVEQVAEVLGVDRVAVYLSTEDDRLATAAARGVSGPHARVAERLLDVALARTSGKRVVEVSNASADARLHDLREVVRESGLESALAAPLLARGDVLGLLAVYPDLDRRLSSNELSLLAAVAAQVAVALQNAQLHEETAELVRQREAALASEREASRRVRALYEISRSFAQSLSLQATLDALVRTVVDVLEVDAAVIAMPDERREHLRPLTIHVREPQLEDAARAILFRPVHFDDVEVKTLFRDGSAFRLGDEDDNALAPFLARGWTGAVVPVATPVQTIAALTILSFQPGAPLSDETVEAGLALAQQAALAIDNARLYEQRKAFAETMQRALLPRRPPTVPGLDIGLVYEPSARAEVGGDVYDFLEIGDGRLAVALGDVTGHGVEATADMAMAKFVFRTLAREHPEPSEFLAAANEVVLDETETGRFITMTYLAVDPARGDAACAAAGHPAPRLVLPDGTVEGLGSSGLALGVDEGQEYPEVRVELPPGGAIVLYTDGVLEARRGGELYGFERLDDLLGRRRELPAHGLARAVTEDARRFAGELTDDLAVVVIKRLS